MMISSSLLLLLQDRRQQPTKRKQPQQQKQQQHHHYFGSTIRMRKRRQQQRQQQQWSIIRILPPPTKLVVLSIIVILLVFKNCIPTIHSFMIVRQQQYNQQQVSSLLFYYHHHPRRRQQQQTIVGTREDNVIRRYVQQQQQSSVSTTSSTTTIKTSNNDNNTNNNVRKKKYQHILAIVAMPFNSMDRILNEQILETIVPVAGNKISIVLRYSQPSSIQHLPTVPAVRRYVSEIYSQLWDCIMSYDSSKNNNDDIATKDNSQEEREIPDVVVYAPNLPNSAPESWIDIQPDLDCICSYDFITGWRSDIAAPVTTTTTSTSSTSEISTPISSIASNPRGQKYVTNTGYGFGGLQDHIDAVNRERHIRKLGPVDILRPVDPFAYNQDGYSAIATDPNVHFIDDDDDDDDELDNNMDLNESIVSSFVSSPIRSKNQSKRNQLYNSVAVGGTFDGMHYGHRKLVSLAVSSVQPITGRLLIGVTVDRMLQNKAYANLIPTVDQRIHDVQNFVYRLAPGMMNRIQIVPITDKFGPPGQQHYDDLYKFDALVVSHETLRTGYELNQYRVSNSMTPLVLLCTRRTEPHSMSSTALRKIRASSLSKSKQLASSSNEEEQI